MEENNLYDGVPAPFDADGNVVPLATRVLYDEDGREVEVGEVSLVRPELNGDWVWCVRTPDGVARVLNLLHAERPDSLERLEKDIQRTAGCGVCGYYDKAGKPCGDCPAQRIQGNCLSIAMRDVMCRTKALAASWEYRFVDEYGKERDVEEVFDE